MKAAKYLILPILLALFLPQILFSIQDRYTMENKFAGKREGIDASVLNLKFVEGATYDKLSWLARGIALGHEMYLIEVEGELSTERRNEFLNQSMISEIVEADLYEVSYYTYLLYSSFYKTPGKYYGLRSMGRPEEQWIKYILLDEQDQRALELWYGNLTLSTNPDLNLEILVDAADGFGYYARTQKKDFPNGFDQAELDKLAKSGYHQISLADLLEPKSDKEFYNFIEGYFPSDAHYDTYIEGDNRMVSTLGYQQWTGENSNLHGELFLEIGTEEPVFFRVGIAELGSLLP